MISEVSAAMKLVCPRCSAKSTVPDDRVPAKGAWAKCPKCAERFFIKPKSAVPLSADQPRSEQISSAPRERSPEAQKIIDRLRKGREKEAESRLTPPGPDLELVTVFPETVSDFKPVFLVLALVGGLSLLGVAVLFKKSTEISPVATQSSPAEFKITQYGEDQLRLSLASLRKSTNRRKHLYRRVTEPGMEFQAFETILDRLAPGSCQEGLDSLVLGSRNPAGGFEVDILCRPKGLYQFPMKVSWQNGFAVITMPGRRQSLSVALTEHAAAQTAPADPVGPQGLRSVTSILDGQVVESYEPVRTPAPQAPGGQTEDAEVRIAPPAQSPSAGGHDEDAVFQSYEDFLSNK